MLYTWNITLYISYSSIKKHLVWLTFFVLAIYLSIGYEMLYYFPIAAVQTNMNLMP